MNIFVLSFKTQLVSEETSVSLRLWNPRIQEQMIPIGTLLRNYKFRSFNRLQLKLAPLVGGNIHLTSGTIFMAWTGSKVNGSIFLELAAGRHGSQYGTNFW
jgi:hypothetical protein